MRNILTVGSLMLVIMGVGSLMHWHLSTNTSSTMRVSSSTAPTTAGISSAAEPRTTPISTDWATYTSSENGLRLKYPGHPFVFQEMPAGQNRLIAITLSSEFRMTVELYPLPAGDLQGWLNSRIEDDPPLYPTNYEFIKQSVDDNSGAYLASTTVDGAPAIEEGFDCKYAATAPNISHHFQVTTVVHGRLYEFGAADICQYPPGPGLMKTLLDTVQFMPT